MGGMSCLYIFEGKREKDLKIQKVYLPDSRKTRWFGLWGLKAKQRPSLTAVLGQPVILQCASGRLSWADKTTTYTQTSALYVHRPTPDHEGPLCF